MQPKRRSRRENTTEDMIPVLDIQNGIVHMKDGRYIKILEVEPINFLLRSVREQKNIIASFASWLKISPVKIQIKVLTKKADISKHLNAIERDMEREQDPKCRELQLDYYNLIKTIGSREAITRRFLIIFEYEPTFNNRKTEYSEIVSTLETAARTAKQYFLHCDNIVVTHDDENAFLLEVLYTIFNRETSENTTLEKRIEQLEAYNLTHGLGTDLTIPRIIAPECIDLQHGSYTVMDGLYHSYLMIPSDGYNPRVVAGWTSIFVNAGEGIDVDIYFQREPKERIQTKLGQQIRINRSKIKDTSDTNSDFDDLSNAIRSGYYLKDGLANNEDFYYAAILVTVTAASVKDLEWRIGEIRKLMVSQDMNLQLCSFRQEAAFLSSLPLCAPDAALFKKYRRNILTSTAASFYPFVSFELCDTNGVLLGVNKYNNSLVSLDNFNTHIYKNANMAILGTSGAGKTFTMQLIARRMRLAGTPVYIIAPLKGHEFYRQAKALNGTIIRIVPGSPDCINVMEIRKIDHTSSELLDGPMPEQSELAAKIQKLHIFFSLLIPDLSNEERQLLDEAIVTTYRNKGITYDNASLDDPAHPGQYREMPILGDLHTVLSAAPETRRIANILNRLVHGSASSFNRQTNVNLDNSYVVIDISELSGDLLTVGMYIGLDYMWDKAKEDLTRRKQIFIDEVWQIIGASSNALAANYVFETVKTIRGYGGGVLVATQDLNDFFSLEDGKYGRGILNNCKIKIILNLEEEEAQRVQSVLKLTDAEIDNITRFERGSALIVTNSNNVTVDMRCSEEEKNLITTDRDELRRIVERKMQNQTETEES